MPFRMTAARSPHRERGRPCCLLLDKGRVFAAGKRAVIVSGLLIWGMHKLFDQGCDLSLYGAKCDIWLGHIDVANLPILNSVFPTTKSFAD
jgi:hypothetical protein